MGDLFALAQSALAAVVEEFGTAGITLPERQYVASGEVVFDCEQLTVEVGAMATGTPGAEHGGAPRVGEVPVALLIVSLIRDCAPIPSEEGKPPSTEAIETAAQETLVDADLLVRVFLKKDHRKLDGCQSVKVASCVPYVSGALAGWILTLRAVA